MHSQQPSIPILIADDQMILRAGLRAMLEGLSGVTVVGEASNGQDAVDMVRQLRPAIVLMDVTMPILDGIRATRIIKENYSDTRVIIFTSSADDNIFFGALSAGADGYCLKNAKTDQLAGAINAVMQGAKWLDAGVANKLLHVPPSMPSGEKAPFSGVQKQILEMISGGLDISEIAQSLNRQITDVKVQLKNIAERLQFPEALNESEDSALLELKAIQQSSAGCSTPLRKSENMVGETLSGKYLIEDCIGSGGMSVVYRARHINIGKIVAIKMLHGNLAKDETSIKRLHREARAASSISHPNIVAIHDFGFSNDRQPYLVMDCIVGDTLEQVLNKHKKLNAKLCLQISLDVCDALAAVHSHNIIHRDLKPSNIMLVEEKGQLISKLLDFGIAYMTAADPSESRLTLTGEAFGSPGFMSPEQCSGKPVDQRSDLYALGCIMYEMLTGESAFGSDTAYHTFWRHLNEPPSRLPFLSPENQVPVGLEAAVFRLLTKNPDRRFQTAQELKSELELLRDSEYVAITNGEHNDQSIA